MLLRYFTGWEEADALTYRQAYTRLGGNASTHPDLLNIQHELFKIHYRYMVKTNYRGDVIGALCVWEDKFLANDGSTWDLTKNKALPIPQDELIFPLNKKSKFLVSFHSKIISSLHEVNIKNSTYKINSGRKICIAKSPSNFTAKTRQTRQREVKKFLACGGKIKSISSLNACDAMEIYDELFYIRRGVHTKNIELNKTLLQDYPDNFFGKILFHNDTPCAMQIIVKAETQHDICFDYINIGYDTNFSSLCLGTILTWLNINAAQELCDKEEKNMRFSFGKPTFSYKARWCSQEPLGRIITL